MTDTKVLELIAEYQIASQLLQAGLFVAKPYFDQKGTDLIAFLEMKDGVKFCRIQCKQRTVTKSGTCITIPTGYVTKGFVVILNLGTAMRGDLYCFFESDVVQWPVKKQEYRLSLTPKIVAGKLPFYRLDEGKVALIRALIERAADAGEFHQLVYGVGNMGVRPPDPSGSMATVIRPRPPAGMT